VLATQERLSLPPTSSSSSTPSAMGRKVRERDNIDRLSKSMPP
jgi:hypothetical protein